MEPLAGYVFKVSVSQSPASFGFLLEMGIKLSTKEIFPYSGNW